MTTTPTVARRTSVVRFLDQPTAQPVAPKPTVFRLRNRWRTPLFLTCAVAGGGTLGGTLSVAMFHPAWPEAVLGLAAVVVPVVAGVAVAHDRYWRTAPASAFVKPDQS